MTDYDVKRINFTSDRASICAVWKACFPEDGDFIASFLDHAEADIDGLAIYENERIVSMALFIPATVHIRGSRLAARYVYGVATAPSHRGQGLAGRILREAPDRFAADMFYLYPAERSLRAYYARFGYRDCCTQRTVPVQYIGTTDAISFVCEPFSAEVYLPLRDAFTKTVENYAEFSPAVLQGLLSHCYILTCASATALLAVTGDTVYAIEVLYQSEKDINLLAGAVQQRFSAKRFLVSLPGTKVSTAMMLPLSTGAVSTFQEITNLPFFGTMFDK